MRSPKFENSKYLLLCKYKVKFKRKSLDVNNDVMELSKLVHSLKKDL